MSQSLAFPAQGPEPLQEKNDRLPVTQNALETSSAERPAPSDYQIEGRKEADDLQ